MGRMAECGTSRLPISVVVPFYQGHTTVQRAVSSVDHQVAGPTEVVLVDDGSPVPLSRTAIQSSIDLISVRHDENRGIPAARNTGIRAASQEWIAFLDQDDEWLPHKSACQWDAVRTLGSPQRTVIFGRCLSYQQPRRRNHIIPGAGSIRRLSFGGRAALSELGSRGNVIPFITLLLHRDIFDRYGYLDDELEGGCDDYELVLRLAAEGLNFRCTDLGDPWEYSAIHHITGTNYSDPVRFLGDHTLLLQKLSSRYDSIGGLRGRVIARSHYSVGRWHDRRSDIAQAEVHYRAAASSRALWLKPRLALLALRAPRPMRRVIEWSWALTRFLRQVWNEVT